MPGSSSKARSTRGSSNKRKKSGKVNTQRKRRRVPSVSRSTEDVQGEQSREAGDESDTGVSIILPLVASEAHHTTHELHPVNHEAVQRGEAPMSILEGASNFNINNADFNQIYGDATIIRFGDSQFTEDQRTLICEFIANHANLKLPDINNNLNSKFLTQSIRELPRAEAVFDDYQTKKKSGPCFNGTRVALLREMADWVTSTDESRMYVLSGLAGIGKSTVAYTIASRAADLNLLGASFFFSRDESDRKNAKKFFTTIAYQLCLYNKAFAEAIGDELETDSGSAITKGPQEQLQAVIVEPLRHIVQPGMRPILIVVDALDECDKDDRLSILTGLKQLVQALPSFKVILTTRPQPHLDRFFSSQDGYKIFRLQDIEDKVVEDDIRLYLEHKLSLDQVQEYLPTSQWCASNGEIDSLVHSAGRLFIIASTVVRIILDDVASNPAAQIKKLLGTFAEDRMPFKDLNEFYTIILRNVVPVDCDDDIVDRYQSVVGAIIFVQHPLPITTLADLINTDVVEIRAVLINLQSVILLGDDDIPRIYHKSFPDYITNSKLCKDVKLYIDQMIRHTQFTICCFKIMEKHLKYNILCLGTPARFMSNEDGLAKDGITDEQLERSIPQELRYACVYWASHLELANIEDVNIMKALEHFGNKHMLHWFEILSLIRKLDSAHGAICIVLNVLKLTALDLHQLLSDGLRFISKSYPIISRSSLHTYYSALPFAPTDSHLYRHYITEAEHHICDIDGGPQRWDASVANLGHGDPVNDIKFSLDSTMLISQGEGMLKIWDAASGQPISTIPGDSYAIDNNFSTIALFDDNVITLHDMNGSDRGVSFTAHKMILKVAISSESSRIAAELSEKTLVLWDIGNGEMIGSFDEIASHRRDEHWYCSDQDRDRDRFQFSATGSRLAHPVARRGFVQLRNGIDGSLIANLDCESALRSVAFSADGSRIATLFRTGLTLWHSDDGRLVGTTKIADGRLAISANGSFLATGNDRVVTLWRGNNKKRNGKTRNPLTQVDVLHLDRDLGFGLRGGSTRMTIDSQYRNKWQMAFSLDDTLAISTNDGIKLYDVDNRSFIAALPFPGHEGLALSPDSTRLAAGLNNEDGTICLWDIRSIEASNPLLDREARGKFTALALSRDCTRIACGFEAGAIELWETDNLAKQPIAIHTHLKGKVRTLVWSPDGRQFASRSDDWIINVWDGNSGGLLGTPQYPRKSRHPQIWTIEASNTMLAAAGESGLFLWDLKTLDLIHTFNGSFEASLSFSADGALLAAVRKVPRLHSTPYQTIALDVAKRTIISASDADHVARTMAFLPDNSQLVVQSRYYGYDFRTFNIANGKPVQGPTFEYLMQLFNMPLWHGVPVRVDEGGRYLKTSSPGHNDDAPVLWFPPELGIQINAQGRSMIALGCVYGRIVLLRLHTTPR